MGENFQCEECFSTEFHDREGSGEDENGEFTDYVCEECDHITRIYDNK